MNAEIRPFEDREAAAAAALLRELLPHYLITAELLVHWRHAIPERAHGRYWIAAVGEDVLGWADAEFRTTAAEPGIGTLWVGVAEQARRAGLGERLYGLAEEHLLAHGAWKLQSTYDDEPGRRFAERHGFVSTRTERLLMLDSGQADLSELASLERAKRSEGFALRPLRDLLDRPHDLHALYAEAESDIPSDDEPGEFRYEDWLEETLRSPALEVDGSFIVVFEGRPVSFAWLDVDRVGRRAEHNLTGTLREFRGRGLARLAKLAAISWCAEDGIDTLVTGNDGENEPMLAINRRLGYRPTVERTEVAKVL